MNVETPLRAIKIHCIDCQGWQRTAVKDCPVTDCTLWAYRFGKRPSKELTDIVENTEDRFAECKKRTGIGVSRGGGSESAKYLLKYREERRYAEEQDEAAGFPS